MARRPNIGSATTDFAFFALALIAGLVGLPVLYAVMVFVGAVASWGWTRRRALMAMKPATRLAQGAIAIAMIAVVLGLAYWIGLLITGRHL